MLATRIKKRLESDTVQLPGVEALIGKEVEIIILDDSPGSRSAGNGSRKAIYGSARGKIWVSPDFDAPLPDEVINEFYR